MGCVACLMQVSCCNPDLDVGLRAWAPVIFFVGGFQRFDRQSGLGLARGATVPRGKRSGNTTDPYGRGGLWIHRERKTWTPNSSSALGFVKQQFDTDKQQRGSCASLRPKTRRTNQEVGWKGERCLGGFARAGDRRIAARNTILKHASEREWDTGNASMRSGGSLRRKSAILRGRQASVTLSSIRDVACE